MQRPSRFQLPDAWDTQDSARSGTRAPAEENFEGENPLEAESLWSSEEGKKCLSIGLPSDSDLNVISSSSFTLTFPLLLLYSPQQYITKPITGITSPEVSQTVLIVQEKVETSSTVADSTKRYFLSHGSTSISGSSAQVRLRCARAAHLQADHGAPP
ncbi:hypothetical protein NPX13_g10594 [Xylaria arbuscula]|uniref:Uncharacterized protein n=1 Tax=Xylaria arbuscula TaxID=114810 RepID=A0A9W8TGM6_9PEZI|nr:hypothetical protein NPX13_g10594 [Xylaria arbuscula]